MAVDVSSLVRELNRSKDDRTAGNESSCTALITRDLLGGGGGGGTGSDAVKNHNRNNSEFEELDLDMQVPSGWEKRLDLKSGKLYLQRHNTPSSQSSSSDHKQYQTNQTVSEHQDLNFQLSPSSNSKPLLNLFDETSLELKLVLSSSSPPLSSNCNYLNQSVCTLDKVKSALERATKEELNNKKRFSSLLPLSPFSYSSSSSSIKEAKYDQETEENLLLASPIAVGCPGCLCYVLILKNNPKCPRCNSFVPLPKKPRIDLNISM